MPINIRNDSNKALTFRAHVTVNGKLLPRTGITGDPRSNVISGNGGEDVFEDTYLSTIGDCFITWYDSNEWSANPRQESRTTHEKVPNNGFLTITKDGEGKVSPTRPTVIAEVKDNTKTGGRALAMWQNGAKAAMFKHQLDEAKMSNAERDERDREVAPLREALTNVKASLEELNKAIKEANACKWKDFLKGDIDNAQVRLENLERDARVSKYKLIGMVAWDFLDQAANAVFVTYLGVGSTELFPVSLSICLAGSIISIFLWIFMCLRVRKGNKAQVKRAIMLYEISTPVIDIAQGFLGVWADIAAPDAVPVWAKVFQYLTTVVDLSLKFGFASWSCREYYTRGA